MIQVKQIIKTYQLGETTVQALRGVDLAVQTGEFMAIAGASGSGKSTLLNIIGTIERPTEGYVEIDGKNLSELTAGQQASFRAQKLGFVFQTFNLLPVLTAYENVEYPLRLQKVPKADRGEKVKAALDDVGLASFMEHRPAQLSGGQRQRVAIARALVGDPKIILADEPTANLDHQTGRDVVELMKKLRTKRGVTLVFATHDPKIMQWADRVVHLEDGQVAA